MGAIWHFTSMDLRNSGGRKRDGIKMFEDLTRLIDAIGFANGAVDLFEWNGRNMVL